MAVIRERIIRNGVSHRNSNGPPATENGGVGRNPLLAAFVRNKSTRVRKQQRIGEGNLKIV
ncbi:hypothetical protein Csa_012340 [Cucumis sativus]|uniref:Uncharacterized protein n=1 Tax=Cucumis sativus TaxID=3659 RepID=A0A0A0KZX0_CUCSA|nr:hypothetical protein Csa_012340 [Cucumis sativus]